jgi:hypothetical protein
MMGAMPVPGEELANLAATALQRAGAKPATHYLGMDEDDRIRLELWARALTNFSWPADVAAAWWDRPFYGFELRYDPFAPAGVPIVRRS